MKETKQYKKVILIPDGVMPTIFSLPCIYSCHKEPIRDGEYGIVYLLYDWDKQGNYMELRPGQWLCECYDGKWEVKDKL